jgi:hypothetical protein
MNPNSKPQAINLGQLLDDESITENLIAINRQDTQSNASKSLRLVATDADKQKEIKDYLDGLKRRKDAALRLPPMPCGCRDPWLCRCDKKGKR